MIGCRAWCAQIGTYKAVDNSKNGRTVKHMTRRPFFVQAAQRFGFGAWRLYRLPPHARTAQYIG